MRMIPLTQGKQAIVDDEDFEYLNQWKWFACPDKRNCYAAHSGGWLKPMVFMHRVLLNAPSNMFVDHINGDGLDNRRCNLRLANRSQNMANRGMQADNTSGYKGVGVGRHGKNWRAQIRVRNKQIHIGVFSTPEEAARAYDDAAKKYFGEYAHLNFPDDD